MEMWVETVGDRSVLSVIRDVSKRRETEDSLCQNEQQLGLLVESVKDYAVLLLDLEGRILTWSPGAERMKGYKAEEIVGQNFSRFFTPEDVARGKPEEELQTAVDRGHVEDESCRLRKDGSRFWAQTILTCIRDTRGKVTKVMLVTCDLAERTEAENALVLELSNAVLSNLDAGQLFSAISKGVRHLMPCDVVTLGLYDPDTNHIRVQQIDPPGENDLLSGEMLVPLEGSVHGAVFNSRQPLLMSPIDTKRFYSGAGIKSVCCVPLAGRERLLGTLTVGSTQEDAFSRRDLPVMTQFANHVGIALDNALAFREITRLRDRLVQGKRYLEEELLTEYRFKDVIGQSPELKRVLHQV